MKITDLHCHILPGLDDGAYSMDETVEMARIASEHRGFCIACTPHWVPGCSYTVEQLAEVFQRTQQYVKASGVSIKLVLGQEIFMSEEYESTISKILTGQLLTLNHSVYPLVEFDPLIRADTVYRIIDRIRSSGLVPVVAHPERYRFTQADPENFWKMKEHGAFLQVNKGSIAGFFGRGARHSALFLLENRLADVAASDAHSPYRRTPPLNELHEWISVNLSARYADYLLCTNPIRVLKNEKIECYS